MHDDSDEEVGFRELIEFLTNMDEFSREAASVKALFF